MACRVSDLVYCKYLPGVIADDILKELIERLTKMSKLELTDREIEIVSRIGMAAIDIFTGRAYNVIKSNTYAAILQVINSRSVEVSIENAKIVRVMLANAINKLPKKRKYQKFKLEIMRIRNKLFEYIHDKGEE